MNLKDFKSGKLKQEYKYKSFLPEKINHTFTSGLCFLILSLIASLTLSVRACKQFRLGSHYSANETELNCEWIFLETELFCEWIDLNSQSLILNILETTLFCECNN